MTATKHPGGRPRHADLGYVSPATLRVYAAVCQWWREKGYAPTMRNLCRRLGVTVNAVFLQVRRLEAVGLIRPREPWESARSIVPAVWPERAGE